MALNRSDKSRILRRYSPGMTRNSEMSTEPRDGRINPENAAWRRLSVRDLERRLMRDGDMILERSGGGPGTPVGRVALIEGLGSVYCNNFCQQLRVSRERCTPQFAAKALWYRYTQGITARLEHQTTGIRNLDYSAYLDLPILLPPLPEQRAIAAVLDSIDDAIEGAEAVIAATERLRDALLHDLLTRGLPGQHTEWRDVPGLGTIPADWDVVRLGDVATVRNGTTPSRRKSEYWGNEGIPFVKTGQVNDLYITVPEEFITHEAVEKAGPVIVPEGSVLIAMIGQGKTRGMTAKLGFRAAINQNFAAVYEPLSGFDLNFFFAWASQNYALIRALGQGSNQDALNCEVIQRMLFPLPPPAEQQTIAAATDGADAAIEVAREERDGLRLFKASTADALLTGRARLQT